MFNSVEDSFQRMIRQMPGGNLFSNTENSIAPYEVYTQRLQASDVRLRVVVQLSQLLEILV